MAEAPSSPIVVRRWFFIGVCLLMLPVVLTGFWPTYFGPLVHGTLKQRPVIHVHAVVFIGWLAVLFTQVMLAATGRVAWHRKLGSLGIGYGALLLIVGLVTGVTAAALRPTAAAAQRILYVATLDMILFATFFGAAVYFRRQSQIHKRLILVAATIVLVAAVFRLPFYPAGPVGRYMRLLVWAVPIVLAVGHDLWARRGIHAAYVAGLCGLVLRNYSEVLSQTSLWAAFTAWTTAWLR